MSSHYSVNVQIYINTTQTTPILKIEQAVQQAAQATLNHQNTADGSNLTIALSDDDHLQSLNRQFAGIDAPTDVLSFPNDTLFPHENDKNEGLYLGDVILSFERAQAQAERAGHPLISEVRLLTVHGVLHLLGHDHAVSQEKAVMWQAQSEILAILNQPD